MEKFSVCQNRPKFTELLLQTRNQRPSDCRNKFYEKSVKFLSQKLIHYAIKCPNNLPAEIYAHKLSSKAMKLGFLKISIWCGYGPRLSTLSAIGTIKNFNVSRLINHLISTNSTKTINFLMR